jgi:Ca2+-binding EF-hand superfamily protein
MHAMSPCNWQGELDQMMSEADADGDGHVDFAEFVGMMA